MERAKQKHRARKTRQRKGNAKNEDKKYAPPTLPKAVANKLWLVLNIHPHPESDVQPLLPPIPMPLMLRRGHHFLLLEVEVEVEEGVPVNDCVSRVLKFERRAGDWGHEGGR
jgi:hypothetical protein